MGHTLAQASTELPAFTALAPFPSQCISLSSTLRVLRTVLGLIPLRLKAVIYSRIHKICRNSSRRVSDHHLFHLPFGLVLKVNQTPSDAEADALRYVSTLRGICTPHLVDSCPTHDTNYLLMTWVEGDCVADVWDDLTPSDKERLVKDLRSQLGSMRLQSTSPDHEICNASGGPIDDPRVPWLTETDSPRTFSRCQDFAEQVWHGLDWPINRHTLYPFMRPYIERADAPIVFSHGDIYPKNLIFPGGLHCWRSGGSRICIVDWEYAGWMPFYWEALKTTFLEFDSDSEWLHMAREIFPECQAELEADWQWKCRSRVLIL